jgi:hypothetical protein
MTALFPHLLKWLVPWLIGLIKDKTDDAIDGILDAISPILEEMLTDAEGQGLLRLSASFRAPYEARIVLTLHGLGLLETT